jgi:hypothetical protein
MTYEANSTLPERLDTREAIAAWLKVRAEAQRRLSLVLAYGPDKARRLILFPVPQKRLRKLRRLPHRPRRFLRILPAARAAA